MLDDLDRTVTNWLTAALGDRAAISFAAPSSEWAGSVKRPVVSCFLYRITEDVDRRPADWHDIRSAGDRVLARQPPVRMINAQYLVSAWATDPIEEHSLLSAVLRAAESEAVLDPLRVGALAGDDEMVLVRAGLPAPAGSPAPHDVWSSLGVALRASLELMFVAPMRPAIVTDIAPPAETMSMDMGRTDRRKAGPLGSVGAIVDAGETNEADNEAAPSPGSKKGGKGAQGGAEPSDADQAAAVARTELTTKAWTTFRIREHVKPPKS